MYKGPMKKSKRELKKKNYTLGIVVPDELRERIQAAADKDKRLISQYARLLIERALDNENGSSPAA